MIAIMISIKPKWYAKIMNGEKTIEFRTSKALANAIQKLIDKYGYADIYVHCSKGNHHLVKPRDYDKYLIFTNGAVKHSGETSLNGKVVFKFRCYKVEEIDVRLGHPKIYIGACVGDLWCLNNRYHDENYLVRAIHIGDLEIFNEPKELNKFKRWCDDHFDPWKNKCLSCKAYRCDILADEYWCDESRKYLTKAPQSYCFIETEDNL